MKVKDIYNFEENENVVISRKEENGYEEQYFHKEKIVWRVLHIDEAKRKALIIAEKPTTQEITLKRTRTDTIIQ